MVQRLQSAANKFVGIIFKLDLRESIKDSMQQLGILTIYQLVELETGNFIYRYLHNKLPKVFNGLLDKVHAVKKHMIREANPSYFRYSDV